MTTGETSQSILTDCNEAELDIFEAVELPEIGQPIEDFTELIATIKKGYKMTKNNEVVILEWGRESYLTSTEGFVKDNVFSSEEAAMMAMVHIHGEEVAKLLIRSKRVVIKTIEI